MFLIYRESGVCKVWNRMYKFPARLVLNQWFNMSIS